MADDSISGKRALVTGASRGIGRATALALAQAGVDVAVAARGTDELEQVAAEIAQLGRTAAVISCDVSDVA
ncbi:MAG TPA: SDR family NAD(P)-dependent oxidoreductase, partial [Ktedonobacterales bacterium]|nr:SDR family NAD(P)-dependent oxidoreductase [Ktedonobacterales bacterium]